MHDYALGEVQRILGVPSGVLRALIRRGFVTPARGPRRAYRFSFQDLIALRVARDLVAAGLPSRRVAGALTDLRRRLPATPPPAGLSIRAIGRRLMVRDRSGEWDSDSGQYLLAFDVAMRRGDLRLLPAGAGRHAGGDRHALGRLFDPGGAAGADASGQATAEQLFAAALDSEASDPAQATRLYRRCLRQQPGHAGARINLARLLQAAGEPAAAERLYRHASCRTHALALFNLGVLLEDSGRGAEALESYLAAVAVDPTLADAHYNLARLYELQGKPTHTLRHLRLLRALLRPRP